MKPSTFLAGPALASTNEPKYKLFVIEDTPEDLGRIKIELAKFGVDDPDIATDYKTFTKMVVGSQYDAVSIDWELNRAQKGKEVLKLLTDHHPEVVKVVYTRHAERRSDALELGADAFLVKSDDVDLSKYSAIMKKAARLGCLRHIVKRLSVEGLNDLPLLPKNSLDVDEEIEKQIRETARQTLILHKINGNKDNELRDLLIRRGWWRPLVFDTALYVQLSWRDKIRQLFDYAEIDSSEAAALLEAEEAVIKTFFYEDGGGDIVGQNLLEALDRLLSILGYLLRLSDYDPELMHYFWKAKDFYKNSFERPPWDEVGLSVYLREQGQQGLNKSLIWIRSH